MNKRDKEILEAAEPFGEDALTDDLVLLVKRLDDERIKQHDTIMNYRDEVGFLKKQLAKIKEAGEPFVRFYGRILYVKDEDIALTVPPPDEHTDKVTYREWDCLAQALEGVKDDKV